MNKKPIEKLSAETEYDSITTADGLQSVRRHNTNTNVAGSAGKKEHELADKWIKELSEAGCTPDDMIAIFRMARKKLELKLKK